MDLNKLHYLPLTRPSFSILGGIFLILLFLIQINALRYTYTRLSLSSGVALLVLSGSLADSYFKYPRNAVVRAKNIVWAGDRLLRDAICRAVIVQWPRTLVAINIGGAVIPTLVSAYLLIKYRLRVQGAFAAACVGWPSDSWTGDRVAGVRASCGNTHRRNAGLTAVRRTTCLYRRQSWDVDRRRSAQPRGLGTPIASIGGAGKFDGIF
jgi:uncharacterized membrane protein